MVTDMDTYLFDFRGYLILKSAIGKKHLGRLNDVLDALPEMKPGEWYGTYTGRRSRNREVSPISKSRREPQVRIDR